MLIDLFLEVTLEKSHFYLDEILLLLSSIQNSVSAVTLVSTVLQYCVNGIDFELFDKKIFLDFFVQLFSSV